MGIANQDGGSLVDTSQDYKPERRGLGQALTKAFNQVGLGNDDASRIITVRLERIAESHRLTEESALQQIAGAISELQKYQVEAAPQTKNYLTMFSRLRNSISGHNTQESVRKKAKELGHMPKVKILAQGMLEYQNRKD